MEPIFDDVKPVQSVRAQSVSGTVNGTGVDTAGFDEALAIFDCGTITASGTLDVKIQESDNNSTFTDVSGAAFSQKTPSNDEAIYSGRIKCDGSRKRYLRAVAVQATAAALASVSFVLGKKNYTARVNNFAFDV